MGREFNFSHLRVQPRVVARPHAGDLAFVPRRRAHHPVRIVRDRGRLRDDLVHFLVREKSVDLKHTRRDRRRREDHVCARRRLDARDDDGGAELDEDLEEHWNANVE